MATTTPTQPSEGTRKAPGRAMKLGSVGGDDTVLIVADATENAEGLRARLAILAGSE